MNKKYKVANDVNTPSVLSFSTTYILTSTYVAVSAVLSKNI